MGRSVPGTLSASAARSALTCLSIYLSIYLSTYLCIHTDISLLVSLGGKPGAPTYPTGWGPVAPQKVLGASLGGGVGYCTFGLKLCR